MSPKKRNRENTGYPRNWRVKLRGSKYYILFRVPVSARHLWGGVSEATLGKGDTLGEAEKAAFKTWEAKIICGDTPLTMGAAFDRYEAEVVPQKSPATRKSNRYSLRRLRLVIPADMPVIEFRTHHAHKYRSACAKQESPKKANLDIEVLSHVFTKCLEWGVPDLIEHPIIGKMTKLTIAPRERYVADWELEEFLKVATPMQQVYVPLKGAMGIDKSLMLRIRLTDITEQGIEIAKRTKLTGEARAKARRKLYLFKDADGNDTGLRRLVDAVLEWRKEALKPKKRAVRPLVISPWLFPKTRGSQKGQCMVDDDNTTGAFDQSWQDTMKLALETTDLEIRFTEHDLCAKTASDVETDEEAARLRGHLNVATTAKVYRRKAVKILPKKTEN